MAKARTAAQKAASRRNLAVARKAKSNLSGTKVKSGSTAAWNKRQSTLAPSTLMGKYKKALAGAHSAKTDAGRKHHEAKAEVFWKAYQSASQKAKK